MLLVEILFTFGLELCDKRVLKVLIVELLDILELLSDFRNDLILEILFPSHLLAVVIGLLLGKLVLHMVFPLMLVVGLEHLHELGFLTLEISWHV